MTVEFPFIHEQYKLLLPFWQKWRDAAKGEDAVKAREETYLPRLFGQDNDEYKQYLRGAEYYNATGRTVDAMVGAHARHEAKTTLPGILSNLTQEVSPRMSLADLEHTVERELWTTGRCGLLAEIGENQQPRVYLYTAESIVNWYEEDDALQFVIVREEYQERDGYTLVKKYQYRSLELVEGRYEQHVWRLVKNAEGKESWQEIPDLAVLPVKAGDIPLDFIPFVFLNFEGNGCEAGGSPIADLANVNLRHYVVSADKSHSLHLTSCDFLEIVGLAPEDRPQKLRVGSTTVLYLPEGGSSTYRGTSGAGIKLQIEDLKTKEDQMARLGATFLRGQKRAAETAESMELQQHGETSVLVRIVEAASKGLTTALRFLASWLNLKAQPSIELSKEFFATKIDIQEAQFLMALYQSGLIGLEQLYEGLQGGGLLKKEWIQLLLQQTKERQNALKEDPRDSTGRSNRGVLQAAGEQVGA